MFSGDMFQVFRAHCRSDKIKFSGTTTTPHCRNSYSIGRPIMTGTVINDKYCPGRGFYGRQLGKSPSGRVFGLCEIAGIGSPPYTSVE